MYRAQRIVASSAYGDNVKNSTKILKWIELRPDYELSFLRLRCLILSMSRVIFDYFLSSFILLTYRITFCYRMEQRSFPKALRDDSKFVECVRFSWFSVISCVIFRFSSVLRIKKNNQTPALSIVQRTVASSIGLSTLQQRCNYLQ